MDGVWGGVRRVMTGYAHVSTGDQDVAGQTLRLTQAGAIKVFTDIRSGRSMDRPRLAALLDYARTGDILTVVRPPDLAARLPSCSPPSRC